MKKERMWDSNKENKVKRQTKRNTQANNYKGIQRKIGERQKRKKQRKNELKMQRTNFPPIIQSFRSPFVKVQKIQKKI
jgi:hypothetical protein